MLPMPRRRREASTLKAISGTPSADWSGGCSSAAPRTNSVLNVGDDDGAIAGTFRRVSLSEALIDEAVEPFMPALGIKSQEVVAQQGQFFRLPQRSNIAAPGKGPGEYCRRLTLQFSSWLPSRRRLIPIHLIMCIAT